MAVTRIAVVALLVGACAAPRTEVLVVTDSDLAVPAELDEIRIQVSSPEGELQSSVAYLGPDQPPLPRVLGLEHRGGSLGPFEIVVTGYRAGTSLVTRNAELTFQTGRTLVLRMHLVRTCVGVACGTNETCAPGGCRSRGVGEDELTEWTGDPPRLDGSIERPDGGLEDAGPIDAGGPVDGCVSSVEICNGLDDDCDTTVDEGFDLMNDVAHCGGCGLACSAANATWACVSGRCAIAACDMGFADCDADSSTGCEGDLSAPETCGSCSTACGPPTRVCCPTGCERDCTP